jgi:hypothetical protein
MVVFYQPLQVLNDGGAKHKDSFFLGLGKTQTTITNQNDQKRSKRE